LFKNLQTTKGGSFSEHRPQKWSPPLGFIRCLFPMGASLLRKTGSAFPHDALMSAAAVIAGAAAL